MTLCIAWAVACGAGIELVPGAGAVVPPGVEGLCWAIIPELNIRTVAKATKIVNILPIVFPPFSSF